VPFGNEQHGLEATQRTGIRLFAQGSRQPPPVALSEAEPDRVECFSHVLKVSKNHS
jgi:hypothetical protein